MADLRQVWVRSSSLELVRADRICSVFAVDERATGGGPARPMAAKVDHPLTVKVSLIGGAAGYEEQPVREVDLVRCLGPIVTDVMTGLAVALAQAAADDQIGPVFVYPEVDKIADEYGELEMPRWMVAAALPDGWVT